MKEELIRVEHGCFQREDLTYRFDISVSRGECVGVYVDDHFTSGTAYLDIFKGGTHMRGGRAFVRGRRVGAPGAGAPSPAEQHDRGQAPLPFHRAHRGGLCDLPGKGDGPGAEKKRRRAAAGGGVRRGAAADGTGRSAGEKAGGAFHAGLLPAVRLPGVVLEGRASAAGPADGDFAPKGPGKADGAASSCCWSRARR